MSLESLTTSSCAKLFKISDDNTLLAHQASISNVLAAELLDHIFSFLTPKEQLVAALVCKVWAIRIFGDIRNQFSLEDAKKLPSLRMGNVSPSFLIENARVHYHMNLRMVLTFAKNLREQGINPKPFPNMLFTHHTLPLAQGLETQLQLRKELAVCTFYANLRETLQQPSITHPNGIGLPDFSDIKDRGIHVEKIREALSQSDEIKILTTLELKPALEGVENYEFIIPEEIALFTSLTELRVTGELLCQSGENKPIFMGSLYFPKIADCLPKLETLKVSFFKTVNSLPVMPKLLVFNLNGCRTLTEFPKRLEKQTSLQKLIVNCCPVLETIPDVFDHLPALTTISFTLCPKLSNIPWSIAKIQSLTHFETRNCNLPIDNPIVASIFAQITERSLLQMPEVAQTYTSP